VRRLGRRGDLLVGQDLGESRADRHRRPALHDDPDRSLGRRLHLHRHAAHLDLDDRLSGCDLGPVLHEPAEDPPGVLRRRQLRELERDHRWIST
jgi:hypothetical protein